MNAHLRAGVVALVTTMLVAGPGAAPSAPARAAAQSPAGATEYVALLEGSREALDRRPPDIARARTPIAALVNGPLVDGGYSPGLALQPILDDLDATPPDAGAAVTRLQTLITALRPPGAAPVAGDHGTARATLKGVYASPAFSDLDAAPQPSWISRLGDAIRRFLQRIQGPGTPASHNGTSAGLGPGTLLVILALLVVIAGVVWWLLRGRLRQSGMVEPAGTTTNPDAEWDAALAAARIGNHREAIRRAFRSSLLSVARHGRLAVDPAWTTRELLARAEGDADLLASLGPAADAFQVAWYSARPQSEADWNTTRVRCETVRTLAARTAAGVR